MSKRRIPAEEKLRIAKACIAGKYGLKRAAEQVGVHHSLVDDWIRLYQTEGETAFLHRSKNRRYDPVLKEAAVKDYLSGRGSFREICKTYKIRSTCQLKNWVKVYNGHKDFKKQTGGSRMTKGRETTQAERIEIAKEWGISANGIPTALCSLPLKSMHTSAEVLSMEDANALKRVVSAFIKSREIGEVFGK